MWDSTEEYRNWLNSTEELYLDTKQSHNSAHGLLDPVNLFLSNQEIPLRSRLWTVLILSKGQFCWFQRHRISLFLS